MLENQCKSGSDTVELADISYFCFGAQNLAYGFDSGKRKGMHSDKLFKNRHFSMKLFKKSAYTELLALIDWVQV